MQVSLFFLPSVGTRADIEAGMAGNRPELYQDMLTDLSAFAKAGDALGYDSISFTEHHFHIEGFEVSPNPIMLDLYLAMQTERIRVGQLGLVLPAHNPIRVAEDIAMLDHMSGGRALAGFARGYQRRWVDTLAQQIHGVHAAHPGNHDAIDAANRAAFEEHFQIIRKCWTEEMVEYKGQAWQIPPEGTPWDIEATRMYGKGVDENNIVRQIGVVPKPLQKPHPPIFQPFASSERTIRWCAREGITAILPPMYPDLQNPSLRGLPGRGRRRRPHPQAGRRPGSPQRRNHHRHRRRSHRALAPLRRLRRRSLVRPLRLRRSPPPTGRRTAHPRRTTRQRPALRRKPSTASKGKSKTCSTSPQ